MTNNPSAGGFLNDKQYDVVKFLTIVVLPAFGTLYFALAAIWGLPSPEQVLGTILAVETFIGAILGLSTRQYVNSGAKYSGAINVIETPDKTVYSLDLDHAPEELAKKDEAIFKVNSE